jgi:hypothetical protein
MRPRPFVSTATASSLSLHPFLHPFTPSHFVHVANSITPYNVSHREWAFLGLCDCGTNTERPSQNQRGGGGLTPLCNFSYKASPHLKIFSANGPRSRLLRSLCKAVLSVLGRLATRPLDAFTQAGYIRVGLLVKRTWAYCPCV